MSKTNNEYFQKIFEFARSIIINELYIFVSKQKGKKYDIIDNNEIFSYIINNEIVYQNYQRLYIKNKTLYIKYQQSKTIKTYKKEIYDEDINNLSANEIYDIITKI